MSGIQILPDILILRPLPVPDEESEQGQEEAAPSRRLFRRDPWRNSGGLSAVKAKLETMMADPLLGRRGSWVQRGARLTQGHIAS